LHLCLLKADEPLLIISCPPQVSELPFPFTNPKQFESSIRQPIGKPGTQRQLTRNS